MGVLLTGGSGQLGQHLQRLRAFIAPSHCEMDITDRDSIKKALDHYKPDLIVHAAAYTNVTPPEKDAAEAILCYQTNVLGTRNLVSIATVPIIFISTETVLHPYNFYALTKLQAENEIKKHSRYTIIRTSFRDDPFEYSKAPEDMLTIGDTVSVIANLLNLAFDLPANNKIVYVGTGVKTVYDLAVRTRPNVEKVSYKSIGFPLAPMDELLNIGFE